MYVGNWGTRKLKDVSYDNDNYKAYKIIKIIYFCDERNLPIYKVVELRRERALL